MNDHAAKVHGLNLIGHEFGDGLAKHPNRIRTGTERGGNSGYQAVSLAILFGAARIILLGYDMQATGNRLHWHRDHGGKLHNPLPRKFKAWQDGFATLAKVSPAEIINCSRETGLTCFPRMSLADGLARAS
jgi:hypothetical protein